MKVLKSILVLFCLVSIVSCGSDDDSSTPSFNLSSENIAGTYEITSFDSQKETATTTDEVTTSSSDVYEGEDFDDLEINLSSNGTFSLSGGFKSQNSSESDDFSIISFDGIDGTYSIDTTEETITFVSGDDKFNGKFDIDSFSTSGLTITQENITEEDGTVTDTIITETITYTFETILETI